MKKNTKDKSLVEVNENSIFYKIKKFFKNIFHKTNKKNNETINIKEENINKDILNKKNKLVEEIKNIENEETKILKLQKQYRSGEIKEGELSEEQIKLLCKLYDKQIENLKKSNEIRKKKIIEYKRRMQTNN